MKFSPGSRRVSAATLIGLWLAGCGGGGGARAEASPNGPITSPSEPPPSASSSVVVYEDITSMELLKGPLDSSSWKTVAAYRRGEDAWSRLAQGRQLAVYRSASARNDAVSTHSPVTGSGYMLCPVCIAAACAATTSSRPVLPSGSLETAGSVRGRSARGCCSGTVLS